MSKQFHSNGKLLLTGEYAVLDGALSLAVPTSYGQSMTVAESEAPSLIWKAVDEKGRTWIDTEIHFDTLSEKRITLTNTPEEMLLKILGTAKNLNPKFLEDHKGYEITTRMDFPRNWGLGSSSTLINNIAQWAGVDAYKLLWKTFTGSGYDIACAQHNGPILYRLTNQIPEVREIDFDPSFKDQLFFVHLNKKQDSRQGIAQYRQRTFNREKLIPLISRITETVLKAIDLEAFEACLRQHEEVMSDILGLPAVKQRLFRDYPGELKSLGAWGGDFIMATGDTALDYFNAKGYKTIIPYTQMVKA